MTSATFVGFQVDLVGQKTIINEILEFSKNANIFIPEIMHSNFYNIMLNPGHL